MYFNETGESEDEQSSLDSPYSTEEKKLSSNTLNLQQVEDEQKDIVCYGIGKHLCDTSETQNLNVKFWLTCGVGDLIVRIGDCVRVQLDCADELTGNDYGYGQVLACFQKSEDIMVEIRWFMEKKELGKKIKRNMLKDNELIEGHRLDDIDAGAISEIIEIHDSDTEVNNTCTSFLVRYYQDRGTEALQPVSVKAILQRGMSLSEYASIYKDELDPCNLVDESAKDPHVTAMQNLHISVIPNSLPCREVEIKTIKDYIIEGLRSPTGRRPLYISGTPGSGKTAVVLAVKNILKLEAEKRTIPEFDFIEINCLRLQKPEFAYVTLLRGLTGELLSVKRAYAELNSIFGTDGSTPATTGKVLNASMTESVKRKVVCFVDEIDFLMTKNYVVLYNLLNWPLQRSSNLILIGVANTMDLPERLNSRLESRLINISFNRVVFRPYNFDQIKSILDERLHVLNDLDFDSNIRGLIARKAAVVTGDLRFALRICIRVIELHRQLMIQSQSSLKLNKFQQGIKVDAAGERNDSSNGNSGLPASKRSRVEKKTSIPVDQLISIVNQAIKEFKDDPCLVATRKSCLLGKLILIVVGKYEKWIEDGGDNGKSKNNLRNEMTVMTIWNRINNMILKDISVSKASGKQSMGFLCPPSYHCVESETHRLCQRGLLKVNIPRVWHSHDPTVQRQVTVSLYGGHYSHTEVAFALKDDPACEKLLQSIR